ncbi:hypothetical protein H920_08303 [Fukomys damarensis]|uniref:Uncharacterized protein n=1 Tax=Fukomys damarensis TaxID=885580 RepID=A0A091DGU1_FUKDA|nr:hypothetical protein H920_08303 [Fukomys damarensis]
MATPARPEDTAGEAEGGPWVNNAKSEGAGKSTCHSQDSAPGHQRAPARSAPPETWTLAAADADHESPFRRRKSRSSDVCRRLSITIHQEGSTAAKEFGPPDPGRGARVQGRCRELHAQVTSAAVLAGTTQNPLHPAQVAHICAPAGRLCGPGPSLLPALLAAFPSGLGLQDPPLYQPPDSSHNPRRAFPCPPPAPACPEPTSPGPHPTPSNPCTPVPLPSPHPWQGPVVSRGPGYASGPFWKQPSHRVLRAPPSRQQLVLQDGRSLGSSISIPRTQLTETRARSDLSHVQVCLDATQTSRVCDTGGQRVRVAAAFKHCSTVSGRNRTAKPPTNCKHHYGVEKADIPAKYAEVRGPGGWAT